MFYCLSKSFLSCLRNLRKPHCTTVILKGTYTLFTFLCLNRLELSGCHFGSAHGTAAVKPIICFNLFGTRPCLSRVSPISLWNMLTYKFNTLSNSDTHLFLTRNLEHLPVGHFFQCFYTCLKHLPPCC